MKVNNINGTSYDTCKCASWLDHWKKFSNDKLPQYCPVWLCFRKSEVGAHVQKDSYSDKNWYIVPLCKKHNGETGKSLEIRGTIKLASANVSETCGNKEC